MPYLTNVLRAGATTAALLLAGWAGGPTHPGHAVPDSVTLTILADSIIARFHPERDWGGALDGHDASDIPAIYTPGNIAAMRTAGLGPITYRLRTELGIETWHWNPVGRWSDAAHHQGYWVSSAESAGPIRISFGYRLPRRGRTIDDANNDGYSRIDDGDTASFWKTNPYLDPRFTHDPEAQHPQWFTVDLGAAAPVRDARFAWGAPYPRRYEVEYWDGDQSQPIDYNPSGDWRPFPHGRVAGHGGDADVRLADAPISTRFLRVLLFESSHTAAGGAGDARDSAGFALREVSAGVRDSSGILHDLVHHDTLASSQSAILVSSTDPWHREIDRDSSTAQPGFDLVFGSGLTNHRPVLVPTGLLFDTPENAAAELRFLLARHFPLAGIELGEEPDGQRVTPEDYAALYVRFAAALHQVDPHARLGGPSWQNLLDDPLEIWPDRAAPGKHPTPIGRFLDYLDVHHRTADYRFVSFEWYPFDDVCADPAENLAAAPLILSRDIERLHAAGLPDSIPRIMTEYGYSAHLSPAEVTLPGALFDADVVGTFFAHGGSQSYYFGYEPGNISHEPACQHWGNLVMFLADSAGQVRYRMPRYYGIWLLTHAWADSTGGAHTMVRVRHSSSGDSLLSAFVLHRPDGRWSLLLVNRDPATSRTVTVRLAAGTAAARALRGRVDIWQYSAEQYQFEGRGEFGRPTLDLPPSHHAGAAPATLSLPAYSITVVSGW